VSGPLARIADSYVRRPGRCQRAELAVQVSGAATGARAVAQPCLSVSVATAQIKLNGATVSSPVSQLESACYC
jgi:hypothetical protein